MKSTDTFKIFVGSLVTVFIVLLTYLIWDSVKSSSPKKDEKILKKPTSLSREPSQEKPPSLSQERPLQEKPTPSSQEMIPRAYTYHRLFVEWPNEMNEIKCNNIISIFPQKLEARLRMRRRQIPCNTSVK